MNILVSGCAGFIGYHMCEYLCLKYPKNKIIGFDNINNFFLINLKKKRLKILRSYRNFYFSKIDLVDKKRLSDLFKKNQIDIVFHFAAQAGVRDSIKNPQSYYDSNFEGYINIIKLSKDYNIKKFIFASSSSVYGDQKKYPINEKANIIPKNIYSATKKFNEDIAEDISKISNMKIIGLRFFTVYGKFGRPDMLIFKFIHSLNNFKKFNLYNKGKNYRDYTHIEDVIEILNKIMKFKTEKKFEIFNVCSNKPIDTNKVVKFISKYLNFKPNLNLTKRNNIEVLRTHGDNSKILKLIKYKIKKNIYKELPKIIDWYQKNKIWKLKN